jgi:Ca2+/H+ antiporter, TMEM165/GDT1 family
MAIVIAAVPAFIASLVEFVEAYTIVLAIGVTRGWRAPLYGAAAALVTLAGLVLAFGVTLATVIDEHAFELVVGSLLLLFGLKWIRKAILRYARIVPLHDEELIYQRQVAELRAKGQSPDRFDWIGFIASYKAMLLEGLEVAFIVIALGAAGTEALIASSLGAVVAFILVSLVGAFVRVPLSRVPENTLKYTVGAMLCTFGVYWAAGGMGVEWPGDALALPVIFVAFVVVSWLAVRMLKSMVPGGRVVPRAV